MLTVAMLLRRATPLVAVLTLPRASPALATARGSPRHPRQRSRQHCARRRSLASAPLVCRLVSQLASCSSLAAPLPTFMPYVVSCRAAYLAPLAIAQTSPSLAPLSPRYCRALLAVTQLAAFNHQRKLSAEDRSLPHIAVPFACCAAPQFARGRCWPSRTALGAVLANYPRRLQLACCSLPHIAAPFAFAAPHRSLLTAAVVALTYRCRTTAHGAVLANYPRRLQLACCSRCLTLYSGSYMPPLSTCLHIAPALAASPW